MSGIYIHIPFCKSKCPYCDFYSLKNTPELKARYVYALISEMRQNTRFNGILNKKIFSPDSLYLGGGTPSVLNDEQLYNIITTAKEEYNLEKNSEITVECNPSSNIEEILPSLVKAGVNRVSLGVQSIIPEERKKLGRLADKNRVSEVINLFKENGIYNISLDLMLGIPHQTKDSLKETLDFITKENIKHISSYILTVEENTPFYKMRETLDIPNDDITCDLFDFACDYIKKAGFEHYEISNFALKGYESRHNKKYWLLEDYLGLGASAHSFLNGKRYFFNRDIEEFLKGTPPIFDCDGGDYEEYIMLKLRLKEGLNLTELKTLYGKNALLNIEKNAPKFQETGLINYDNNHISLTQKGILISNTIISELI